MLFILASGWNTVYATTTGSLLASSTVTVQTPTVQLQSGTVGSSTVSNGVYATVTSSALPLYYVPVTLTNNQGSPTPNPFQVLIQPNPSLYSAREASDLGNVRFCLDTGCNAELYSWLEGCGSGAPYGACSTTSTSATFWIKLTSSIAGNGGTLTIYMTFLSTSTDFDGIQAGEAPTLSGTYAQFDDGANVFTQYGGKSWSSFTPYEGTWDTTNGYLEQTSSSSLGFSGGGPAALITSTSYPNNGQYVIETAFSYSSQAIARVGIVAVAGLSGSDPQGYRFIGQQSNDGAGFISFLNDLKAWVVSNTYAGSVNTAYTMQVVDNGGTWSGTLFSGYGIGGSSLTTLASTAYTAANNAGGTSGYVGISATYYTSSGNTLWCNPASFQWFRMRAYPPSGVMPSATFGSLTGNYVLAIANGASSSWNANLAVASSSNTGRLTNLTIWFHSPTSDQIRLGTAVTQLTTGPVVTLPGSGTLYIALYASSLASGSSTVTLSLKIQLGSSGPYAQYTIYLTVNC